MNQPPLWSESQLETFRRASIELFRASRRLEPVKNYTAAFDEYRLRIERLLERTANLTELRLHAEPLLTDRGSLELIRYLAGPLISADDLNTLLGVNSFSAKQINADPNFAAAVIDLVVATLDSRRFPWVQERRTPSAAEQLAAVVASATLFANRKVATSRRNTGKEAQESAVAHMLDRIGWSQVPPKSFDLAEDGPKLEEYCRESIVCRNKADIVVRLGDRRLLLIECKVSNSSVNSIKRLNDAKKKATEWRKDLGESTAVPAAVLGGVFDLRHLLESQARGLALFWGYDLDRLARWIKSTKRVTRRPASRRPR